MNTNVQSEICQLDSQSAIQTRSRPRPSLTIDQHKILNIPHIAKRMNKVQTYVKNFNNLTLSVSRRNRHPQQTQQHITSLSKFYQYSDSLDQNTPRREVHSIFLSEVDHKKSQKDILSGLICTTLASKDSISKVNSLNRLEQTYVQMKNSIKVNHRILPKISNFRRDHHHTSKSKPERNTHNVTQEQIDRHIKSTIVEQQGKKYFGDLYLLKKGRDKVMHSLEKIGRQQQPTDSSQPYDKIVQDLKNYNTAKHTSQQQTRNKIVGERQANKKKMMTKKHMHWNVYYDMLALSKHEKSKLQRGCHFATRYGIA